MCGVCCEKPLGVASDSGRAGKLQKESLGNEFWSHGSQQEAKPAEVSEPEGFRELYRRR